MPRHHVIQQGESVISIAEIYGFYAVTLWDHASNAELRRRRKFMNILLAGDVVTIPDPRPKNIRCETGLNHVFRRRGVPALFRLRILRGGRPRVGLAYTMEVHGKSIAGVTDANGVIEMAIPANAKEGVLCLDGDPLTLRFGHLDPTDSLSGVKARLDNLGFSDHTGEREIDRVDHRAIVAFQRAAGLRETGELDDATRDELTRMHDEWSSSPGGD